MVYAGDRAAHTHCSECKSSRCDQRGKPYQLYHYFPVISRLKRLFAIKEISTLLSYPATYESDDAYSDIYDGKLWETFKSQMSGDKDVAFGLAVDGVPVFRRSIKGCYSVWPISLIICNLPPWARYMPGLVVLVGVVPAVHVADAFSAAN
jgi:hypothetical protein